MWVFFVVSLQRIFSFTKKNHPTQKSEALSRIRRCVLRPFHWKFIVVLIDPTLLRYVNRAHVSARRNYKSIKRFSRNLQLSFGDNGRLHCEHLQVSPLHVLIRRAGDVIKIVRYGCRLKVTQNGCRGFRGSIVLCGPYDCSPIKYSVRSNVLAKIGFIFQTLIFHDAGNSLFCMWIFLLVVFVPIRGFSIFPVCVFNLWIDNRVRKQ